MGKFDGISAEQVQDRSWKFEEFQDYFQKGKNGEIHRRLKR